jgi:hypothetical protein
MFFSGSADCAQENRQQVKEKVRSFLNMTTDFYDKQINGFLVDTE